MSEFDFSKCPLCNAASPSDLCDRGNIYFYHCDTCTDYFISRGAAKWIDKHERHRKGMLSKNAASCKGKTNILAITLESQVIQQEVVPRNKYHCI